MWILYLYLFVILYWTCIFMTSVLTHLQQKRFKDCLYLSSAANVLRLAVSTQLSRLITLVGLLFHHYYLFYRLFGIYRTSTLSYHCNYRSEAVSVIVGQCFQCYWVKDCTSCVDKRDPQFGCSKDIRSKQSLNIFYT